MMIPSLAPSREIPTGLAGMRSFDFRGIGRLGAVNVGPLAQAQFNGQLRPSYATGLTWQPSYTETPQVWPNSQASAAFASQVASLLGGSAVQVPGNQINPLNGSEFPLVWVVQLSDGSLVDPAGLFPQGVSLSFPDECTAERELAMGIPGATMSSTCAAGGSGETPTQLAVSQGATPPVTPGGQSTVVGYTPPVPVSAPVSVAQPSQTSVSFSGADTCSSVVSKIAALQAAGQSNVVIWNQIPSTVAQCEVVKALNPQAPVYTSPAQQSGAPSQGSQPGDMSGNGDTGQQSNSQSQGSNTNLYIGLAIAAGLALFAFGGRS